MQSMHSMQPLLVFHSIANLIIIAMFINALQFIADMRIKCYSAVDLSLQITIDDGETVIF